MKNKSRITPIFRLFDLEKQSQIPWKTDEVMVIDPFYNKIIFFERRDVL
ncbi:hypothetical protein [Virgibacillus profundi]|nr:hypothetical protein [Virgibacillus profundi]